MDETKLRTIAQLQEFLDATPEVSFTGTAGDGDTQRYEHISGSVALISFDISDTP